MWKYYLINAEVQLFHFQVKPLVGAFCLRFILIGVEKFQDFFSLALRSFFLQGSLFFHLLHFDSSYGGYLNYLDFPSFLNLQLLDFLHNFQSVCTCWNFSLCFFEMFGKSFPLDLHRLKIHYIHYFLLHFSEYFNSGLVSCWKLIFLLDR
jgi:hypothetical protein